MVVAPRTTLSMGCCWCLKFIVLSCTFVVFHPHSRSSSSKKYLLVEGININYNNNNNNNNNNNIITEKVVYEKKKKKKKKKKNDNNSFNERESSVIVNNNTVLTTTEGLIIRAIERNSSIISNAEVVAVAVAVDDKEEDDSTHRHDDDDDDDDDDPHNDHHRMSISNMTCDYFRQPLNHFVPRGNSPTYMERYCTYDGYAVTNTNTTTDDYNNNNNNEKNENDITPIFFYTGNESPLEQYINQTGLMWELAPKFNARIVFAEHRYEGKSLPTNISKDCLSYASTIQAVADYAKILEDKINPGNKSPVIVFGGSYGGMLSAWMRMKYPHLIAGAIAASAPIGAFPQSANLKIDYSARVLAHGLDQSYPPTKMKKEHLQQQQQQDQSHQLQGKKQRRKQWRQGSMISTKEGKTNEDDDKNHCRNNLLAVWPLLTWLARQEENASFLQTSFSMCDPLTNKDAEPLLRWAQRIWFDLAEGSFPYPSSYVPFALLHKKVNLPAWPMQDACWKSSNLNKDWNVRFSGSLEDVRYRIDYGDSGIQLDVDWDTVTLVVDNSTYDSSSATNVVDIEESNDVVGLLTSVRDAVSIWYNITKDVTCYNISQVAPNTKMRKKVTPLSSSIPTKGRINDLHVYSSLSRQTDEAASNLEIDPVEICHEMMVEVGSWTPLCCNDEMNLVITTAHGLGHDFFWPPSLPRSIRTYQDMIRNQTFEPCSDPYGIYGYSKEPYEPLSTWLDTYYGGISMKGHSNIIFSNGLLDPWSAGGVFKDNNNDDYWGSSSLLESATATRTSSSADRASIQNITENDVIALIIPFGGHHTDLMYKSESDPDCVTEGRQIEEEFIARWIRNWVT